MFPDEVRHGIAMSDNIKDLITKLLEKNPEKRIGSKQDADDIVNHPWYQGFDWQKLCDKEL